MTVTGLKIRVHVHHILVVGGEWITWRCVILVRSHSTGSMQIVLGVRLTWVQPLTTTASRRSTTPSHLKPFHGLAPNAEVRRQPHLWVVGISLTTMAVLPIEFRTVFHREKFKNLKKFSNGFWKNFVGRSVTLLNAGLKMRISNSSQLKYTLMCFPCLLDLKTSNLF